MRLEFGEKVVKKMSKNSEKECCSFLDVRNINSYLNSYLTFSIDYSFKPGLFFVLIDELLTKRRLFF
jgi:hypothetical protein